MKKQLTILLIILNSVCWGQVFSLKDTSWYDGCNWTLCKDGACTTTLRACEIVEGLFPDSILSTQQDSLTAERFFTDSLNNQYMISYSYVYMKPNYLVTGDTLHLNHTHFIANCSITRYHGNKSQTILSNYKAIYSPTQCSSDNTELWLKRLYQFLNKK